MFSSYRRYFLFHVVKDEFVVVDGKAKTKGKERRVFLFEKIIIFSEPMTREGGLPEFRYVHSMKVNIKLIHLEIGYIVTVDNSNIQGKLKKVEAENKGPEM